MLICTQIYERENGILPVSEDEDLIAALEEIAELSAGIEV